MANPDDIVKEVYSWMGTPYHSMARVKGVGVDCGQLCIAVYENVGLIAPVDTGVYSPEWHLHRSEEKYLAFVLRYCEPTDEPKKGDILVYQYGRCVSHGGIYVGNNTIIHAYVNRGVIESPLDDCLFFDKKGRSRYRGAYTLKKG